ncbi:MAG: protease [Aquabacterium sp.]|nr:hypothetical protein [Dechloromonas sp.]MCH2240984.1 protease [Aquabacterium sp.]
MPDTATPSLLSDAANPTESAVQQNTPAEPATAPAVDPGQGDTPATGADPAAKPAEEPAPEPDGAPETYDFKLPDGVQMDDKGLEAFGQWAKGHNLTQDKAQTLLESLAPAIAQRQAEQVAAVRQQWADESKADKEFGGDKLDESLAVAKKAHDAFASDGFKELLKQSGLGNHPEVIRTFLRIGKAISEDTLVLGAGQRKPSAEPSVAQRMYPGMNP